MQALSDIEARFQSTNAMAAAIREALAPLPVSVPVEVAVPVPVPVEVRLPAPHRRAWVMPATLSVGVLLGGGGVFGLMSTRTGSVPGPNIIAAAGSEREPELPRGLGLDEPRVREAPGATPGSGTTPMISAERPLGSDLRKPDAGDPGVVALAAQATPTPTRSGARRRGAVATAPTKQGFAAAMIKLEPAARHCARANGVAEDPVQVEVRRGADGTVDAVRIWDMSVRHPFARCIDKLVRDAALPNKGAPVESFELFRDRAPR